MLEFDREGVIERICALATKRNESLNHALTACGFKDFAVNLRKGSNPTVEKFFRLANYFGVSISYILTGEEEKINEDRLELLRLYDILPQNDRIRILERMKTIAELAHERNNVLRFESASPTQMREMRVFDQSVSAGTGDFLDDSSGEIMNFREELVPQSADFGVKISGDSMTPTINNGDIVWVKGQNNLESGQIGIFVLNGDAYCKKLKLEAGHCFLMSLNKRYKPIKVLEDDRLFTVGRVLL